MLTYLGQTTGDYVLLNLSESCRQILPMLQAASPENIEIIAELPTLGPHIKANRNQLHQVLTD